MRFPRSPVAALLAASALSFIVGLSSPLWLRALLPQLAVTRSYFRETRLHSLWPSPSPTSPASWFPPAVDPWDQPWRAVRMGISGFGYFRHVYSTGPNRRDEGGDGDDIWPTPHDEDRRVPDLSRRPSWPVLYLDLVLMFGVPGALWWMWSFARLWSSPRQSLPREASLCVVAASAPSMGLAWLIQQTQMVIRIPDPPGQPLSIVDPAIAFSATGALLFLLTTAALRSWRRIRTSPPE